MEREDYKKFELVKAMNTVVMALNHEGAYYDRWIYVVPDCATDEDFLDIAEDGELFEDAIRCFGGIMKDYSQSGIYIGNKLYPLEYPDEKAESEEMDFHTDSEAEGEENIEM